MKLSCQRWEKGDKVCNILHSDTKEQSFTLLYVQELVPMADSIWATALHDMCCSVTLLFPDKMK